MARRMRVFTVPSGSLIVRSDLALGEPVEVRELHCAALLGGETA